MLKLKTYCWNYCNKIIFKYVNSTVRPIFNEKVAKKWNLWVHKQYMMHCLLQKSQHLLLLFIKQYMNSNRISPKRVKKKKKKSKTQNANRSKRRRVSKLAHNLTINLTYFTTYISIFFFFLDKLWLMNNYFHTYHSHNFYFQSLAICHLSKLWKANYEINCL